MQSILPRRIATKQNYVFTPIFPISIRATHADQRLHSPSPATPLFVQAARPLILCMPPTWPSLRPIAPSSFVHVGGSAPPKDLHTCVLKWCGRVGMPASWTGRWRRCTLWIRVASPCNGGSGAHEHLSRRWLGGCVAGS